jgi:hypothetical protein
MNAPPQKERRPARNADHENQQIARGIYYALRAKSKGAYIRQLTPAEYLRLPLAYRESLARLEHKDNVGRVVGRVLAREQDWRSHNERFRKTRSLFRS